MTILRTKMDSTTLTTRIGLEIHVQLATNSKMFCRCNNNAEGKAPNTVVCPICLGLPGTLPVANRQAVEYTIKTGMALGCKINKIAKFDRKHYFYPDLPKGYQISQYDEPFASGGCLKLQGTRDKGQDDKEITIRLNRIHLEEDAGKLIHFNGKSLVDLNRAGTPLMEIVTEPDIESPLEAGAFLRKLQKAVRDEAGVSEASMEKGHMRCDANISVNEIDESYSAKATQDVEPKVLRMSQIIELKNINSFRFVERALKLAEEKLRNNFPNWPEKISKETWGYDSTKNEIYQQRRKEEAADYRYFPEPDLPPFDMEEFNLEELKKDLGKSEDSLLNELEDLGLSQNDARTLLSDKQKVQYFEILSKKLSSEDLPILAKAIVHNYFSKFSVTDERIITEIAESIGDLSKGKITKQQFGTISQVIIDGKSYKEAFGQVAGQGISDEELNNIIDKVLDENSKEVEVYKNGKTALLGFFMGQVMKEVKGVNPAEVNKLLLEKLS